MPVALETVSHLLAVADRPEDVFGLADPRGAYRRLALVAHPDRGGDSDVFRSLDEAWRLARRLIEAGAYGRDRMDAVTLTTRRGRRYVLQARAYSGDACDVFLADDGLLVKVARRPADNDLVRNEAGTLRALRRDVHVRWLPFLPELVDSVAVRQRGGVQRQANVLRHLDGFYTLAQVIERYPGGVDPRDMAWMWRRLLAVLGAVHGEGVTHVDRVAAMPTDGPRRWRVAVAHCDVGPVYEPLEPTPEAYRGLLAELAPVTIESHGPAAAAKREATLA